MDRCARGFSRQPGAGLRSSWAGKPRWTRSSARRSRPSPGTDRSSPRWPRPGVGKSRLLFEFKATSAAGWMVLEAFSVSHGKASAFLPVIDLLHGYFDVKTEDDARKRREKITGRVLALDRSLEDTLPYLCALLGLTEEKGPLAQMDAQIRQRRTLDAIKRLLLRESLKQPLMVIFEDLHWIDDETQALLNLLADSIATARVLLLVNYRPEYTHSWGSKTYYTQLRLDALGGETAHEMLGSILGEGKDLIPLKRLIIDRTEGNPFFMEEIVQALFEEGALERNGTVKLAKPMSEVKVPATVQAVLSSRIDRLPPAEKDLLQTVAVIGKEFSLRAGSGGRRNSRAGTDACRSTNRRVHLRAARRGGCRVHLQARADSASRIRSDSARAPQSAP